MHLQKTLPLDGQEDWNALWKRFPIESRREIVEIYARLLVLAVGGERKKENSNDQLEP
jgi:hypothetical protein